MLKALIGISCGIDHGSNNISLRKFYGEAVEALEAAFVVVAPQNDSAAGPVVEHLDGLILSGGGDIHPVFWAEEAVKGIGRVDLKRDEWEIALTYAALQRGLPILGICRGMQVINVALGGSVWQDNPSPFEHCQTAPYNEPWHAIKIIDPHFAALVGTDSGFVNSSHHQAVCNLGKGLKIAAKAQDDTVEAVIGSDDLIGVQWHPEYIWQNEPVSHELFNRFIKRCLEKKQDYP